MNGQAGKGDRPRPMDKQRYDENYTRIFGGKKCPTLPTCKTLAKDDSLTQEQSETEAPLSPDPT
jgi:hypothetical protein